MSVVACRRSSGSNGGVACDVAPMVTILKVLRHPRSRLRRAAAKREVL